MPPSSANGSTHSSSKSYASRVAHSERTHQQNAPLTEYRPSSGSSSTSASVSVSASTSASTQATSHPLKKSRPTSLTSSMRNQAALEALEGRPRPVESEASSTATSISPVSPGSPRLRRKRASRDLTATIRPASGHSEQPLERKGEAPAEETWSRRTSRRGSNVLAGQMYVYDASAPTPPPAESGKRCGHWGPDERVQSG